MSTLKLKSLLVVVTLFIACGYDAEFDKTEISLSRAIPRPIIQEGIVAFRDISEFQQTLMFLQKIGERNLEKWETSIGFLHSLRKKTQSYEIEEKPVISPFFASVINENGEFIIGDNMHKITDEREYIFSIPDASAAHPEKSGIFFPIRRHKFQTSSGINNFGGHDTQWKTPCLSAPDYDDSYSYRVELEGWSENFFFYADSGSRITYQEYKSGGLFGRKKWRDTDAWHLKVTATAKFRVCPTSLPCTSTTTLTEEDEENLETNADVFFNQTFSTGGASLETDEISARFEFGNGGCNTAWSMVWK